MTNIPGHFECVVNNRTQKVKEVPETKKTEEKKLKRVEKKSEVIRNS